MVKMTRRIWITLIVLMVLMVAAWFFVQWRADACHHRGGVFTGNGQCVAPGVFR